MKTIFQYAVKVVLGKSEGQVVAPGDYWTAVNVHNPHNRTIILRKKIAIALPHEKGGPITRWFEASLKPDQALEIDRDDIFRHADGVGTPDIQRFLKGFVVIQSYYPLDVVAVYTAADQQGILRSIHTERVIARKMNIGDPDLVPVPDDKGFFCRKDENGNLLVRVTNQGSAASGPCKTAVDFGRYGIVTLPTPPLAPGASVDLVCAIPRGCYDPDCNFRITVDVNKEVMEETEGNNIANGFCLG